MQQRSATASHRSAVVSRRGGSRSHTACTVSPTAHSAPDTASSRPESVVSAAREAKGADGGAAGTRWNSPAGSRQYAAPAMQSSTASCSPALLPGAQDTPTSPAPQNTRAVTGRLLPVNKPAASPPAAMPSPAYRLAGSAAHSAAMAPTAVTAAAPSCPRAATASTVSAAAARATDSPSTV